jgi:hypothetical protein
MDSKIKTLNAKGILLPDFISSSQYDAVLSAMDIHAKNLAVEFLQWYNIMSERHAEQIVTDFLQSDYLKERTEG